ncbi:MAG: hypothetical protein ABIO04_09900 [Ferruginibacter sp.]
MRRIKHPSILLNVFLPIIVAIIFLYTYQRNKRNAEEIGLGESTFIYTPYVNNYPIHINNISLADSMKRGWELNGSKLLSLWFGNSQVHGINQYKDGQQNCIQFCYDYLQPANKTILGISYPNANLQEILLSVLFFTNKFPQAKTIIVPVFYDDMREDGIRNDLKSDEMRKFFSLSPWKQFYENIPSIASLAHIDSAQKNGDMKALHETAQEASEKFLDSCLYKYWSLWTKRSAIRANIFNDLYILRNTSLGIKANTIRKMIPGRFKDNYNAFLNLVAYGKSANLHILIYIPPLRNDVTPPFNMEEYEAFKQTVEHDATLAGAKFLMLENLVPPRYWGAKPSTSMGKGQEIDFMHFQQEGHRMIGDTISKTLLNSE